MRKLDIFILSALFCVGVTYGTNEKIEVSADETGKMVYIGGMSAGFTLKTGGAQVIGLSEVITECGAVSPASKAGLRDQR